MNADQPHISKLILILCDILLLNFDLFPLVSDINPILLPTIFSNLYEIFNSQESFLNKWDVLSITEANLKDQFPSCLEILDQFDPDFDWIELHCQLLLFAHDFNYFISFLEKVQTASTSYKNSTQLLKLFSIVLSCKYMESKSSEDQLYFTNIIEIVVSLSDSIIEHEDLNDDFFYEYVINLWDIIFLITDFFNECDQLELLNEIVSHYLNSVPHLFRRSLEFTDSLNYFSEFLSSNNESEILSPFIESFLSFLCELVDSDDNFFKDIEIVNCFNCLQEGFEELFHKFIVSIVEKHQSKSELPESFFLIVSSTEPGFLSNFAEFASSSLIQMMAIKSDTITAETALFFIRKVIEFVDDQTVENLIFIVFGLFEKDSNGACETIQKISEKAPSVLCHFSSQIISIVSDDKIKLNESCSLVVSLFKLLDSMTSESEKYGEVLSFVHSFIDQYLNAAISLFDENSDQSSTFSEKLDFLNEFLHFLVTLFGELPESVSADFKSSLFDLISPTLKPVLLIQDDETQDYFCKLFELFLEHEFINERSQGEFMVEWISHAIQTHPRNLHFNLVNFLIDNFEIPSILEFIIFYYGTENEIEQSPIEREVIINVIHQLFLRQKAVFWNVFEDSFLVSLLAQNRNNLLALNVTLDLFIDVFKIESNDGGFVTENFAVMILQCLFESMIDCYYERQIKCVLKIVHLILRNRFLSSETVISIFLEFFDVQFKAIEELISSFSSQNTLDEDEEEFNADDDDDLDFDLDAEYRLMNAAVFVMRRQRKIQSSET